jgi:predicted Holliday junction resolvase-like endonuclease
MYRTPPGVILLIILLILALFASGIYIYKLRQDIIRKDQEITMMRENLQREKAKLLSKIKQFENKTKTPTSD